MAQCLGLPDSNRHYVRLYTEPYGDTRFYIVELEDRCEESKEKKQQEFAKKLVLFSISEKADK